MTDDKARIGLQVNPDTKAQWESYIDDSDRVNSLSQLIRVAVSSHINSGGQMQATGDTSGSGVSDEATKQLRNLVDAVGNIEQTMDDMDGRLADVERHVSRTSELTDLENEIYAILPTTDPTSDEWTLLPQEDREATASAPSSIAKRLDINESTARKACRQLRKNVGHVRSTPIDGGTLYWKEG